MGFGRRVLDAADAASRLSDGVLNAQDLGQRAQAGAERVRRGTAGVHRVGLSGRRRRAGGSGWDPSPRTIAGEIVGAELYHSDGDREVALAALDQAFTRFRADVEPRATAIDAPAVRQQWWRADAMPNLSDWALFRTHQASWVNRIATEWSTYEAWLVVLRGMRAGARAQGLVLSSPEPDRLPETMFERAQGGRGSKIEAAWTIGKVLLYTAIGVVGAGSLYTVWRDLRTNKEET